MLAGVFLFIFLKAALAESITRITGYPGDTVTLPSGVNSTWTLSKVQWSVFPNNTWIATYRNATKNTERFYLYRGRLSLNDNSGDLTIENINTNDDMEYSVTLFNTLKEFTVNKVKLTVKQRLQKPTIVTKLAKFVSGSCLAVLNCSSVDEGVDLTWQVEPPAVTSYVSSDCPFLLANLKAKNHAKFHCTSRRNTETESADVTLKCEDDDPQPTPQLISESRNRYHVSLFFLGCFVGVALPMLIWLIGGIKKRETEGRKTPWEFIKEKFCPSEAQSASAA